MKTSANFASIENDKGMVFKIKYVGTDAHGAVPLYVGASSIFAKTGVTDIVDHAKTSVADRGESNSFVASTAALLKYKEIDESVLATSITITGAMNGLTITDNIALPTDGSVEELFSFVTGSTSLITGKYSKEDFIALLKGDLVLSNGNVVWKTDLNKIVAGAVAADIDFLYKNVKKVDIRVELKEKTG